MYFNHKGFRGTNGETIRMKPATLCYFALAAFALVAVPTGCTRLKSQATQTAPATSPFRFTLAAAPSGRFAYGTKGRLLIIVAPDAGQTDLRDRLDDVEAARTGAVFGMDATLSNSWVTITTGEKNVKAFPANVSLSPGTYRMQAVFAHNPDLRGADAPGNLYSDVQTVPLPAEKSVSLMLNGQEPPDETVPQGTASVRYVKLKSERLSKFHKRDIFLRAGVVLPPNFDANAAKPYPMCVTIGGFHTRYTVAKRLSPHPDIVQVMLDGDGVNGDSYSTNSAVSGDYGDATVYELLPEIEKRFGCGGAASRRFTTGGSTGGWVSLALQVYYPDTFGGCWSGFPDSLDFRAYQNINLYRDANAYKNADGTERVSARDAVTGQTKWTVREECQLENVRGVGGSYVSSGGQWGAWNAVYGTPDKSGRPVLFWNPVTGDISRTAADAAGKRYDLRRYCADNWKTLAPKLDSKIHVWVGERDEYFLNCGVHYFDDFLKTATPRIKYRTEYSPVAGHGWNPRPQSAVLDEMLTASNR